jgi:hypothetical protein
MENLDRTANNKEEKTDLAPKSPFLNLYDSCNLVNAVCNSRRGGLVRCARMPERRDGPGIDRGRRGITLDDEQRNIPF